MNVTLSIFKMICTLLLGIAGSILSHNIEAELPALAKRLLRIAAKSIPDHERSDYLDENEYLIDSYAEDSRNLRALSVGLSEWHHSTITRRIHTWLRDEQSVRFASYAISGLNAGIILGSVSSAITSKAIATTMTIATGLAFGYLAARTHNTMTLRRVGTTALSGAIFVVGWGALFGHGPGMSAGAGVTLSLMVLTSNNWIAPHLAQTLVTQLRRLTS